MARALLGRQTMRFLALAPVLALVSACQQSAEPPLAASPEREERVETHPANGPLAAATVLSIAKRSFVVLDYHVPTGELESVGPATLLESSVIASVTRALARPSAELTGRRVRLYGRVGVVCEGTLGPAQLLVRSEEPTTDPDEAWDSGGEASVVAEVTSDRDCEGAFLARDAAFDPPSIAYPAEADRELLFAALSFVRKLPSYTATEERYAAEVAAPRPVYWDEYDAAQPTVRALGATYAWVSMSAGAGCGDFGGSLDVLLRRVGSSFVVVHESAFIDASPLALVADGPHPTVLFDEARLRHDGDYLFEAAPIARHDCGC